MKAVIIDEEQSIYGLVDDKERLHELVHIDVETKQIDCKLKPYTLDHDGSTWLLHDFWIPFPMELERFRLWYMMAHVICFDEACNHSNEKLKGDYKMKTVFIDKEIHGSITNKDRLYDVYHVNPETRIYDYSYDVYFKDMKFGCYKKEQLPMYWWAFDKLYQNGRILLVKKDSEDLNGVKIDE